MQILLIIIAVVVVTLLVGILLVVLRSDKKKKQEDDTQSLTLLLQQMNELTRRVDDRLGESSKVINESLRQQFGESQRLVREITRELTEVKETGKHVLSFADQLKSLQDILKNPKQRGILGEYYLETTLKNVLPPKTYQMQYAFPDGHIVDAAVFVRDKVIPIDSKFSLENYNRLIEAREKSEQDRLEREFKSDLKARIDETSKYIQPDQGTMDFAFMFIPHEAIYYDLLVNEIGAVKVNTQDLIEYAFKKNVLIVSPTSFLAFLQTVLQGLKALQIEENAKNIQKRVSELGKHIAAYEEYHGKVGKTLGTVVNHYNASSKELGKMDKDILRITGESIELEVENVEKPTLE